MTAWEMQDPEHPSPAMRKAYTDKFPLPRLEAIVRKSLQRKNMTGPLRI
jgi:hypothetical protein